MGGHAFESSEGGLYTPRMPKAVYESVKARCQRILSEFYVCVASPIDGPGKSDFGDVDFHLAVPKMDPLPNTPSVTNLDSFHMITRALDAHRFFVPEPSVLVLAIAWPEGFEDYDVDADGKQIFLSKERHIQIDLRVCSTLEQFHWIMFKHSHGDIWSIIGATIRPYGLVMGETAFWLSVPEIEDHNKKQARIFLTSDPAEVLAFLSLPIGNYWDRPFESLQDMYEYAAKCRLMHVPALTHQVNIENIRAGDRRRMEQRSAFRMWFQHFLPECRAQGRFSEQPTTREDVVREAFDRFHVEREYVARLDAFILREQREYIWKHVIKDNIPNSNDHDDRSLLFRNCLVKALKRIILEDDQRYGIYPREPLRDARGHFIMHRVLEFVGTQQWKVGLAAYQRHMSHVKVKKKNKQSESSE